MSRGFPKYSYYIKTAINAAKLSIEMFNRVEGIHSQQATLIFNAQSWELLAKGLLIKKKKNIYNKNGRSITAEQAINRLQYDLKKISNEENKTIQQVISLRNEAFYGILPVIDDEIIIHLLYFSLNSFRALLKENFKTYSLRFDKNYLSIAFKDHTFYSNKVSKLFRSSKKFDTQNNKILYLLDRGVAFAEKDSSTTMKTFDKWKNEIKSKSRKARIARHLSIYSYIKAHDDVRFIPVHVSRGYKPEIELKKTNNPMSLVVIKKTDPNVDFPHLTSDLASKLGKNQSFIAMFVRKLKVIDNDKYCTRIRTSRSGSGVPKYSDAALNYLGDFFCKHPDFNPYN